MGSLPHPARMGGSTDKEEMEQTRAIDVTLIDRLRSCKDSKPKQMPAGHPQAVELGGSLATSCKAGMSASRRSVSYSIAADVARVSRKRLVAELTLQPQTPRRKVHVPVEVVKSQRSVSSPPAVSAHPRMPTYMKASPQRDASTIAPECDW